MKTQKYSSKELFKAVSKAAKSADLDHTPGAENTYYVGLGMMGRRKRLAVQYRFTVTRKGDLVASLIIEDTRKAKVYGDDLPARGEGLRHSARKLCRKLGVKHKHVERVVSFLDTIVPTKRMLASQT